MQLEASNKNTVVLSMEQFDKAILSLEIAKSFFHFLSADIERDDSIFKNLESNHQQALLCGVSCLLNEGTDNLTTKEKAANVIR